MRNIFLVTLQWPLEPCMQSAAFKIERQLPHVTTQKHMHITYADTHMCVSLQVCTGLSLLMQISSSVTSQCTSSNSKLQDTSAADVAPGVAARSANNPSQQQVFHEI